MKKWTAIVTSIGYLALGVLFCTGIAAAQAERVSISEPQELPGVLSVYNHAGWWSPMAARDGMVFASYLVANEPQDDVYVARRSEDGTWTGVNTGFTSAYNLGHTQACIAVDGDGHLHLVFGMHHHEMRMANSNRPLSIAEGFTRVTPEAFAGGRYTYPSMATTPNGDVYMIVRDMRGGERDRTGRFYRFDNTSREWSQLPPFAGQQGTTIYPDGILADANGDLHIIWEWAPGGPSASRHYGSYARFSPATGTFHRADGTAYDSGPIALEDADVYQPLEGSERFDRGVHGVQSAKMTLDDEGRPIVAYAYSIDGTAEGYEHRLARWDGLQWVRQTITKGPFDTDKPWVTYSDGMLRYYGALSPDDPRRTEQADMFLRISTDLGETWSEPIPVTQGIDVKRPFGVTTADGTDYLYLPSISVGKMYVVEVRTK